MAKKKDKFLSAKDKLGELLDCGNERVELSAAKEILAMAEDAAKSEDKNIQLEVTIRVLE